MTADELLLEVYEEGFEIVLNDREDMGCQHCYEPCDRHEPWCLVLKIEAYLKGKGLI